MNSDEQKKREASGRETPSDSNDVNPNKQGISNRPGDEDPDEGVDPAPGPAQTKGPNERNK